MSVNKLAIRQKLYDTRLRLVKGDFICPAEREVLVSLEKALETLRVTTAGDDIISGDTGCTPVDIPKIQE